MSTNGKKVKYFMLPLPPELHRWLKGYAAHQDTTMTDLILGLIKTLRKREERRQSKVN